MEGAAQTRAEPALAAWYDRTLRWGQTNLVEIDPNRYDRDWWREHWRRTKVQGVIVNAGGIVAYYPTEIELHEPAFTLGGRDLYGEIVKDAREEGLTVIARMDSNRVSEAFYRARPSWIAVDHDGRPYTRAQKYVTCINSAYYSEFLPAVMREIISRSSPDGFADNSWAGLPRDEICHCVNCQQDFRSETGLDLPRGENWDNEAWRAWIRWSYRLRIKLWRQNNVITTEAGGPDCLWLGMIHGDLSDSCRRFVDLNAILDASRIIMLDHQRRNRTDGFGQNTEVGQRLHGIAGWDILIPESTPQYQLGNPSFRLSAMPAAEVKLWATSGFAGGIQPWWHHIGSAHEDRRQFSTAKPIFDWHAANEDALFQRAPLADVGVVWSQENIDFFGRHDPEVRAVQPYRGAIRAMETSGLSALPVHADRLGSLAESVRVLILPNLAAMTDAQCDAVAGFVDRGGHAIATGETSFFDENGDRRAQPALGKLFGVTAENREIGRRVERSGNLEISDGHSYLRLLPSLAKSTRVPDVGHEAPGGSGDRHPVLRGLDDTDILPFGGHLPVLVSDGAVAIATYIPDFPIFPPETAWMRCPITDIPAITVHEAKSGGRLVWIAADLDRCFAREGSHEHAAVISNAVRWCLDDAPAVSVEGGKGLISVTAYRQLGRVVLHLCNRLIISHVPGRQSVLLPVGPLSLRLSEFVGVSAVLRVAGSTVPVKIEGRDTLIEVPNVHDHEVIVVSEG